jgi:hypothetical protein
MASFETIYHGGAEARRRPEYDDEEMPEIAPLSKNSSFENGSFENRHYIETRRRFRPETMHHHSSESPFWLSSKRPRLSLQK